jgi:hypothetical protein
LGLIEKIGILEDQIYFLPSQLIKIRVKIARKSIFWVKLKKFTIKDHFKKGVELWGRN